MSLFIFILYYTRHIGYIYILLSGVNVNKLVVNVLKTKGTNKIRINGNFFGEDESDDYIDGIIDAFSWVYGKENLLIVQEQTQPLTNMS